MRTGRRDGFRVIPMSDCDIRMAATNVRKLFCTVEHHLFDIVRVIELKMPKIYPRFHLEITSDSDLPDREAEFDPITWAMRIRESVYLAALEGDGHCRVTLAHELAHFFLHRFQRPTFGRSAENGQVPYCENSEWQADTFARHLLAPKHLAVGLSIAQIMVMFEVSRKLALIVSGKKEDGVKTIRNVEDNLLPGLNWNLV